MTVQEKGRRCRVESCPGGRWRTRGRWRPDVGWCPRNQGRPRGQGRPRFRAHGRAPAPGIRRHHLDPGGHQALRQPHRPPGHHLRRAAGQDLCRPRALRHGKVRAPEDRDRAAATRGGPGLHRRRPDRRRARKGGPADPAQDRRALPGRGPVRFDEPLRQHRLSARRAHEQDRQGDPEHRLAQVRARRARRPPPQAPRRGVRRHAQAGRSGSRVRPRARDPVLRRAGLRARPRSGSPTSTT